MCRTNEHGVHEERVIRPRADDANLDAELWIPAGETVEAIQAFPRVEVVESALAIDFEGVLIARDIHGPPPDVLLGCGILNHALVVRRTAGLRTGISDERAIVRDAGVFLIMNRVHVELARREVAVNFGDRETVGGEIEGCSGCGVHSW